MFSPLENLQTVQQKPPLISSLFPAAKYTATKEVVINILLF